MRTLYQQFFMMTVGNWLLPAMKKAQGLQFPSRQFEQSYDNRIGWLFLLVLIGVVVLVIAKHVFVIVVFAIAVYGIYLWRWCRSHRITTARARKRLQQKRRSQ